MSFLISLYHKTCYNYDRPVFLSPHIFRLKPAAHSQAIINSYSFHVEPQEHKVHWQQDVSGNFIARVDFDRSMEEMSVEIRLDATLTPTNPFDFLIDDYALTAPFFYPPQTRNDLWPYLEITDYGFLLSSLVSRAQNLRGDTISFLVNLNNLIYKEIAYSTRMEEGVLSSEQTLQNGIGACRDSAWLQVQVLRHLGLASRFVSGYLVQILETGGTGSVDLHAWAEVYIPGAGWIGLDATSGLFASEGHIPLACSPRPKDAMPVTGTTGPTISTIHYENTVSYKVI
ncbi:transglutaminase family protein [Dyadobacter arcticus]|uniref:Transglutaminase-like putative cysteine protease n=1 Tax=Dyadobacter arcticus TaxID=1078754 RepID=A0ABX0URK9_9BACT|nr:transglutaminase family protein [Dyadobacter arcticus]NIJ54794.1 transglutaminase-like putative cysteine protease [Dyadobacter arcticus]